MSGSDTSNAVLTTLGEEGVIYCSLSKSGELLLVHLPCAPVTPEIKSSGGAGDSFLGGFLSAQLRGESISDSLKLGTYCAFKSVECSDTINKEISCSKTASKVIKSWENLGWDVVVLYEGRM